MRQVLPVTVDVPERETLIGGLKALIDAIGGFGGGKKVRGSARQAPGKTP